MDLRERRGIVAVPTLLVGVWGMNFDTMPELHLPCAYPGALAIMGGRVMWLLHRQFERAGWL